EDGLTGYQVARVFVRQGRVITRQHGACSVQTGPGALRGSSGGLPCRRLVIRCAALTRCGGCDYKTLCRNVCRRNLGDFAASHRDPDPSPPLPSSSREPFGLNLSWRTEGADSRQGGRDRATAPLTKRRYLDV